MMTYSPTSSARPVAGRDIVLALLFAALTALVLGDAIYSIANLGWKSEELGYILLAPMMVAWLAFVHRQRFVACRLRHEWVGLLILAAGFFLYWHGFHTDPVIWRAGAVVAMVGAVVVALGWDVLRQFAPAFGACVFLIPVFPNGRLRLAVPLERATANATQVVCDIIGMDVDRAGSILSINGVSVAVVEACNGMRMVITLFLVCYVVAFTIPLRWWVRVLFLAASPVVAITCNVVRLVPTVWLFGNSSRETAEQFHDISGWGMSLAAFGILLAFCWFLNRLTRRAPEIPAPANPPAAKVHASPEPLVTAIA